MSESLVQRLRRINASPPPEESIALRAAVLLAVLAAAGGVLSQGVGGPGLRLACVAGIPAGFLFSYFARNRDRFWLKVVLAVALLVVFVSFLDTAQSLFAGGSPAQIQIPLAELFLWVQLLHSMDVPARRDLMFSLASSLTLMAAGAVLSVSLGFAPWVVAWALAALTSLVLAYRREVAVLPALGAPATSRPASSVVRAVVAVVAVVGVLGTGTLLVVPASATTRTLAFPARLPDIVPVPVPGGLSNPSLGAADPAKLGSSVRRGAGRSSFGYFGFSDSLDTGLRGRPDNTLVMRVKAPAPDFWRGQTFDHWDGRRWTQSDVRPRALRGDAPIDVPPTAGDDRLAAGSDFVQTFYVARGGPNLVFGAYQPAQLYFPDRAVFQLHDGSLRAATELPGGTVYTVVSHRPAVTPDALRAAGSEPPPTNLGARYHELPASTTDRTRTLAAEVTSGAPTTYDKVRALEQWMATHTRYSLNAPPLSPSADAVDQFLFVDRVGFCEQIGTSLVVMLRSLGIPARLAVGYVPGERNPFTGLWEVRAKDAHAWAEVWFPGTGWQAFDPTASVPLAGDAGVRAAGSGLVPYLVRHLPRPPAAVVEAALAVGSMVLVLVVGMRLVAWRRRRRARPRRSWADLRLAELEAVGARLGAPRRPHQTAREYAGVLEAAGVPRITLRRVVDGIEVDAFSGAGLTDAQRAEVDAALADAGRAGR